MSIFKRFVKIKNTQIDVQTENTEPHIINNNDKLIPNNIEANKPLGIKNEVGNEIIQKYLSNRDIDYFISVWDLTDYFPLDELEDFEGFENFISFIIGCKESCETDYKTANSLEEKKDILRSTEYFKNQIEFMEDFKKLYEIIYRKWPISKAKVFTSIIDEIQNYSLKHYESVFESDFDILNEIISEDSTEYDIIYGYCKINIRNTEEFYNMKPIIYASALLKYGKTIPKKENLIEIIEKAEHNAELDFFEENLGKERPEIQNDSVEIDYDEMDGYEFEEFVASLFEKQGYNVWNTPKSGDQGADIIIEDSNEKTVVQVKKYEGKVSNSAVQQVVASKNYYSADAAIVVTNSEFTHSAVELARANNVSLIDGTELEKIVNSLSVDQNYDEDLDEELIQSYKRAANYFMECTLTEPVTYDDLDFFIKHLINLKEKHKESINLESGGLGYLLNEKMFCDGICAYLNEHGLSITPNEFEEYWERNELELNNHLAQITYDDLNNEYAVSMINPMVYSAEIFVETVFNKPITAENLNSFFRILVAYKEKYDNSELDESLVCFDDENICECFCNYLNNQNFSITPEEFEEYWEQNELKVKNITTQTHSSDLDDEQDIIELKCPICDCIFSFAKNPDDKEYTIEATCPNCNTDLKIYATNGNDD